MRTAATTPILLVRPPSPEAFPHPPTTLSGLMAFVSAIGRAPTNAMVIPGNGNRQADMLLTMMTRAAAEYGAALCVSQHVFHPASLQALMDALQTRPNQLRLSLSCRMDNSADEQLFVPNRVESIVQVLWRTTRRLPDLGFFKAVSRAGIWNHLILDGPAATAANRDAIARQPNIVHSWQANVGNGQDTAADDGYGGLRPLPGRPLWQILTDPIHCLVLIDRFGKNWLLRSRADNQGDRILTLGETMSTHFCPQDQLPGGYLDEICAMVAAGGTVATTHVRSNLKRAYLIGYVSENGIIVGNSSLKHPRPQYIENVRRQSGLDLTGFVERGYTSVRPEYRGLGIGTRLLEGLTARAGDRKIFSVIAEDNEATKIIARRNRTRKVASYHSEKAGKPVGIWMPEWMIDDHEKK